MCDPENTTGIFPVLMPNQRFRLREFSKEDEKGSRQCGITCVIADFLAADLRAARSICARNELDPSAVFVEGPLYTREMAKT